MYRSMGFAAALSKPHPDGCVLFDIPPQQQGSVRRGRCTSAYAGVNIQEGTDHPVRCARTRSATGRTPVVSGNDVHGNAGAAVRSMDGTDPTMRANEGAGAGEPEPEEPKPSTCAQKTCILTW